MDAATFYIVTSAPTGNYDQPYQLVVRPTSVVLRTRPVNNGIVTGVDSGMNYVIGNSAFRTRAAAVERVAELRELQK